MAKTLISRLDAENIVRAAVDPESHEATGDVYDSVNDVSYPFGGGGGGAEYLHLTLKLNNVGQTVAYLTDFIYTGNYSPIIEYDNTLLTEDLEGLSIEPGESGTYTIYYRRLWTNNILVCEFDDFQAETVASENIDDVEMQPVDKTLNSYLELNIEGK